jgi:hypothetical protein
VPFCFFVVFVVFLINVRGNWSRWSRMDNPETLATLATQDTRRWQSKQKTVTVIHGNVTKRWGDNFNNGWSSFICFKQFIKRGNNVLINFGAFLHRKLTISLNVKGHIWNSPLTYNFAYSGKVKLKNERYSSWNAAMLLCFTEEIRKLHPRSTRLADSTLTITISGDLRYLRLHVINPLRFSLFFRPILMNLGCNCLIIF